MARVQQDFAQPGGGTVQVQGDIVLIEGNYLLLDLPGWRDLKNHADYTICIQAEVEDLRDRLINRKQREGVNHKEAVCFVDNSDLPNARLCIERTMGADLVLRLEKDDSYSWAEGNFKIEEDQDCGIESLKNR